MNYETAAEIEVVLAEYFNPRQNIIVPNVTWGLNLSWECDLAIATKTRYLNEVEIKVSIADLRRDKEKRKWQFHAVRIRHLWFAVPEKIKDCLDDIPESAGLIWISTHGVPHLTRRAKASNVARKLRDDELLHLAHLGAMRIWSLKRRLLVHK